MKGIIAGLISGVCFAALLSSTAFASGDERYEHYGRDNSGYYSLYDRDDLYEHGRYGRYEGVRHDSGERYEHGRIYGQYNDSYNYNAAGYGYGSYDDDRHGHGERYEYSHYED